MSIKDCKARVAAAMEGASDEEVVAAFKEAARIVEDTKGKATEEIIKELDSLLEASALEKKIEVRNRALNELAKVNMKNFVAQFDDPTEGFEALLVGVNRVKGGSRNSVAATQEALKEAYLSSYVNDLDNLGRATFDAYTSGVLDDDIVRALWDIDFPERLQGMNPEAVKIAKVINKHHERVRTDANKAGAFIKKAPSYVTRQTHDMDKIRNTPKTEWMDEVVSLLDSRTFEGVDNIDDFMSSVYDNLSTGIHHGSGSVAGFKGHANLGKKVSAERVLHFKDAEAYLTYSSKYGRGGLSDNIMSGMMLSSQNTALMQKLGVNAEMNLEEVMTATSKSLKKSDQKKAIAFEEARRGKLDNYYKTVSGQTSIPANQLGAFTGQVVRGLNSLTMLGGAVISAFPDTVYAASELRYQGMNYFESYAKALSSAGGALGDMAKSIVNRRLSPLTPEKRRVMAELAISLDSMTGAFRSRFDASGDPLNSRVSDAMRTFFRLNGLTLWTDSMRGGAIIGMAQHLGDLSGSAFGKLPKGIKDTLKLYDIGEGEWGLISSVGTKTFEGVDGKFITPESLADIKDDAIKAYLKAKGVKDTKFQIQKTREDLQRNFRTYYVDRSQFAVIEPDAKTRAMMLRDTQAGTVAGEFMRSITQFKSFPFALVQRVWGREIFGRESKRSSALALAETVVASTLFGYISMSAKDILKNREPRDPTNIKTWTAASLQGGGAGIFGDFLFGELKQRHGGGVVATLAGPTASQADTIFNLVGKVREGDETSVTAAFNVFYKNYAGVAALYFPPAALLNTAYAKAAMDNLIYYNVMEALDRGYKKRMEQRIKRENDQELLFK